MSLLFLKGLFGSPWKNRVNPFVEGGTCHESLVDGVRGTVKVQVPILGCVMAVSWWSSFRCVMGFLLLFADVIWKYTNLKQLLFRI